MPWLSTLRAPPWWMLGGIPSSITVWGVSSNTGPRPAALITWWRHQMETFSALLALCAGNSPVIGEFPSQRPVTRSFDVFFDLRLNKRLSKQSWDWWFEAPSRPLWRHSNEMVDWQWLVLTSHGSHTTILQREKKTHGDRDIGDLFCSMMTSSNGSIFRVTRPFVRVIHW